MVCLGRLPFIMSSPITNATRPATNRALPGSSIPHPVSCKISPFRFRSMQPAFSLVGIEGKHPSSHSKRDLVVTRAASLEQNDRVVDADEEGCGLGIVEFLRDKSMLITGATGFVGKVLIEKILRSQPDVGKLFLLIQGPNQEHVIERLKKEIINAELFKRLKGIHGNSYEAFMLSKLVPVVGQLEDDSLGLDETVTKAIAEQVDVIVSCAANTRFDERYDVAMNTNTIGASRLVKLARKCKKLQVFLHVSTAYVNGTRTGLIKERPFFFGDSIARQEAIAIHSEEIPPILNIGAEVKLINDTLEGLDFSKTTPIMKELALERAKIHGWQNVYSFTKAMGEMVIGTMSNNIPTVIVRPTIIGSTIQDPFPGWIQGLRMADPIIVYYGKGQLNLFTAEGKTIVDLVPADMVVNASLAAMVAHGSSGAGGLNIYHIGTSSVNPLRFDQLFSHCYQHYLSFPLIDSQGKVVHLERMKLFDSLAAISSHLSAVTNSSSGKITGMHILKKLSAVYLPYTSYKGRFDIANAKNLMKNMSREERGNFSFDVAAIEWKDYIVNVHIHGLRKHVIRREC